MKRLLLLLPVLLLLAACGGGDSETVTNGNDRPAVDDAPGAVSQDVRMLGVEPILMQSFEGGIQTTTGPNGAVLHAWTALTSEGFRTSAVTLNGDAWAPLDDLTGAHAVSYAFDVGGAPVALVRQRDEDGYTTALDAVRWDGASWAPLGTPVTDFLGIVDIPDVIPSLGLAGSTLVSVFAGNSFTTGEAGLYAVAFDGTQWRPLGRGPFHPSIELDDFKLIMDPAGQPVVMVAPTTDFPNTMLAYRWNGTAWREQPTYRAGGDQAGFSVIVDALATENGIVAIFASGTEDPILLQLRGSSWGRIPLLGDPLDLARDRDGNPLVMVPDAPLETNLFVYEDADLLTLDGELVLQLAMDGSPLRVTNGSDDAIYALSVPGGMVSTESRSALIFRFGLPSPTVEQE